MSLIISVQGKDQESSPQSAQSPQRGGGAGVREGGGGEALLMSM